MPSFVFDCTVLCSVAAERDSSVLGATKVKAESGSQLTVHSEDVYGPALPPPLSAVTQPHGQSDYWLAL